MTKGRLVEGGGGGGIWVKLKLITAEAVKDDTLLQPWVQSAAWANLNESAMHRMPQTMVCMTVLYC